MRIKPLTKPIVAANALLLILLVAFAPQLLGAAAMTRASEQSAADTYGNLDKKPKALTASTKRLNFGNLAPFEASAPKTVIIRNPNSSAVEVSSISSSNAEFVPSVNCVGSLPAKGNCAISVVFTPSSDGKKSAKLTIVDSASKTVSVSMKGNSKGLALPTPTATATATPTPTSTPTPMPTTVAAACPTPSAGSCLASGPPSVSSIIPSSAVAGSPGFPLAVCGCNLTASTTVEWNAVGQTTSFVSSNQVNASIPATNVASVGVDQVTVSAASLTSAPETFFVGSTGGTGYAESKVDQEATDIVNDPVNQVIYLSVNGGAATNGNTISVLSLASAQITASPFVGSNPDVLAISDDSSYLYAGIDGSASVQRFTLPSLAPDISYSLGRNNFFGPYYAVDLQVAPGAPHTTAVSLGIVDLGAPAIGGIEIFDDSTARPSNAVSADDFYCSLQWGSDDSAIYAANNEVSSFDFYVLSVNPSGIVLDVDHPNEFDAFEADIHFDARSGLIYSDDGQVVNPATGGPVGAYSVSGTNVMVPDSTINRAFFVSQQSESGTATIEAFDLTKFSSIASVTIPDVSSYPLRIIRWGSNGLAFNTYEGAVYLIGGNFVH
jgi:Abnormal spindle-like microcephaly-assoc'd, ASPM-SPD-2-Hydin